MRPVEAVRVGDWVLKGYHLTLAGAEIEPATVAAAVEHLGTIVEAPLEGEPSHGFYVLHHGEDALWLIVWTWRYADIVSVACSRASLDSPRAFTPLTEALAGCVWELRRPGPRTRGLGPPHDAAPVPRPVGVPGRRPPGGPGRGSVGGGRTTRPTDRTKPIRRESGHGAVFGPLPRWCGPSVLELAPDKPANAELPGSTQRRRPRQPRICELPRRAPLTSVTYLHTCPGTARESRDPAQFRDKCGESAGPPVRRARGPERSLGMSKPHVSHVSRPGTDRYPGGTEAHPKAAHTFDARKSSGRHWTTPMAHVIGDTGPRGPDV
jgi:hypothetical protein